MPQTTNLTDTYTQMNTIVKNTVTEFQKPIHKNRFFNNIEYLIGYANLMKFDKKTWHLRPEFFCYDIYGSPELFRVILLVNGISSRFNFRAENFRRGIITPTMESIQDVLSQKIQ